MISITLYNGPDLVRAMQIKDSLEAILKPLLPMLCKTEVCYHNHGDDAFPRHCVWIEQYPHSVPQDAAVTAACEFIESRIRAYIPDREALPVFRRLNELISFIK